MCEVSKVRTDQELVLATQAENRIIVDINSIENGIDNQLKMMRIPNDIKVFKQKVNDLFNIREQQQMRGGKSADTYARPDPPVRPPKLNPLDTGLPRKRGRPSRQGLYNEFK